MSGQGRRAKQTSWSGFATATGMCYTWAVKAAQCRPTTPTDLLLGGLGGLISPFIKPAWGALKGIFSEAPEMMSPSMLPTDQYG